MQKYGILYQLPCFFTGELPEKLANLFSIKKGKR